MYACRDVSSRYVSRHAGQRGLHMPNHACDRLDARSDGACACVTAVSPVLLVPCWITASGVSRSSSPSRRRRGLHGRAATRTCMTRLPMLTSASRTEGRETWGMTRLTRVGNKLAGCVVGADMRLSTSICQIMRGWMRISKCNARQERLPSFGTPPSARHRGGKRKRGSPCGQCHSHMGLRLTGQLCIPACHPHAARFS